VLTREWTAPTAKSSNRAVSSMWRPWRYVLLCTSGAERKDRWSLGMCSLQCGVGSLHHVGQSPTIGCQRAGDKQLRIARKPHPHRPSTTANQPVRPPHTSRAAPSFITGAIVANAVAGPGLDIAGGGAAACGEGLARFIWWKAQKRI